MSNTTHIHGTINITPDFGAPGSVPMFQTVKLEYRTVLPGDDGEGILFLANSRNVIGALFAEAPEWVTEEMVLDDLTAIMAALPPETKYDGYFEARSVDYGDMWRVYIADGKPIVVQPTITWPEVPGGTST